ncbi:Capsular polysaccharide biosynthesis protein [Arthrobacter sp. 49Tsu3.1M3]|uniref:glycosyltransferase family 61 protein n=1 Tax=Arthrobacter sp. 49Tsu3.1M3 TaxID=1279029 RepID=UPI0009CA7B5E|nr:glycosyltransferase 61 family protein [Arthrobacter sp. 49Tsu3.1M3]SKB82091.1 Capsular polysaccharide biosynthesis protein [Arthrobacter sp. 49Tsu3.1M3]
MTIDAIGLKHGIDQSSLVHNYLHSYERELRVLECSVSTVAIISGSNTAAVAKTFSESLPNAKIVVLQVGSAAVDIDAAQWPQITVHKARNLAEMHLQLAKLPDLQLLVEDGTNRKSEKLAIFRELFLYVDDGGLYVAEDLHASHLPKYVDSDGENVWQFISRLLDLKAEPVQPGTKTTSDDRELAAAIDRVINYGKIAFVTKRGNHLLKIRDHQATEILEGRFGSNWGHLISLRKAGTFRSKATVSTNRHDLDYRFKKDIAFPAHHLREYSNAVCSPGQVALLNDVVLPDSFRHLLGRRLTNKFLTDSSPFHARMSPAPDESPDFLAGNYFYLDTEYPNVYGHIPTEVISRLWGWNESKVLYPNLKALVSPKLGERDIPTYEIKILNAFGISDADIVRISHPTRVERLLAATPMFSNPKYVVPEIDSVWSTISKNLRSNISSGIDKVFLSRQTGLARNCRNSTAVEAMFRQHGFTILRPEALPLGDQIELFSGASVVAGYGGSALLNGVFSDHPSTRIVIAPDTYNTANEYLISSITGDDFHYFWCKADVPHPPDRWTWEAFESPYEFDFDRDGDQLDKLLASL